MQVMEKKKPYVVEWRDGFKVNVPQVDQEHRHLFTLVRALSLESVTQTLDELLEYVVVHFSNEQDIMERMGYPAFEDHLKLHEAFSAHVADFLSNGDVWDDDRLHELRSFLNKWLIGHIMTHDLRFGKWVENQKTAVPVVSRTAAAPARPKTGFLARLFNRN